MYILDETKLNEVSVKLALILINTLKLDEANYPDIKLTDEIADWFKTGVDAIIKKEA